jgi:hypothetical protein
LNIVFTSECGSQKIHLIQCNIIQPELEGPVRGNMSESGQRYSVGLH